MKYKSILTFFGTFSLILATNTTVLGHNYPIFTDSNCVRSIVGESAGEPYKTKLGIACVIRNRGSLQGVYGYSNSKMIDKQSIKIFNDCKRAWAESLTNNIVPTAKYWGGPMDISYFEIKLHKKPILTIGKTRFYN